jgi:hypothetical protein
MYKIPETFDASALENETIFQIAFGLNYVSLYFNKGMIQVSGSFSICYLEKQFTYDEVYPVENDFGLLRILEKKMVRLDISDDREELKIEFEGNTTLYLIANEMYESYLIVVNGNEIRV